MSEQDDELLLEEATRVLEGETRPGQRPPPQRLVHTLATLPLALAPASPPAGLRALLLDAVSSDDPVVRYAGFARRFGRLFQLDEERVRAVLASSGPGATWEPYIPGVGLLHFEPGPALAGIDAGIVRFAAGMKYPRHAHLGDEHMLILAGGLVDDETGARSLAGDYLLMPPGSSHGFTILPDEDCVAAVLLHGGLPQLLEEPAPLR